MRRKREALEVFGMSFLDMISCGLGGVLVLMLIMASLAETGGGRRVAIPSTSAKEMPKPTPFFHLGVICSGGIEPNFVLRVLDEDKKQVEDAADRLEIRSGSNEEQATLSVLQRGWANGCLRIEMGNPTYTDSLLEPLRKATTIYTNRQGAGSYDQDLGTKLLGLIRELATSRRKDAWDRHVDQLRTQLANCSHPDAKKEMVARFEEVASAWDSRQEEIASAPGCELQLATAVDVQVVELLPLGLDRSCVVAVGGDYGLLATCDTDCGAGS